MDISLINQCISTLIATANKLVIPELGALLRKHLPDGKEKITFSTLLRYNDGVLQQAIEKARDLTPEEALLALKLYVEQVNKAVTTDQGFTIPQVGILKMDELKDIVLVVSSETFPNARRVPRRVADIDIAADTEPAVQLLNDEDVQNAMAKANRLNDLQARLSKLNSTKASSMQQLKAEATGVPVLSIIEETKIEETKIEETKIEEKAATTLSEPIEVILAYSNPKIPKDTPIQITPQELPSPDSESIPEARVELFPEARVELFAEEATQNEFDPERLEESEKEIDPEAMDESEEFDFDADEATQNEGPQDNATQNEGPQDEATQNEDFLEEGTRDAPVDYITRYNRMLKQEQEEEEEDVATSRKYIRWLILAFVLSGLIITGFVFSEQIEKAWKGSAADRWFWNLVEPVEKQLDEEIAVPSEVKQTPAQELQKPGVSSTEDPTAELSFEEGIHYVIAGSFSSKEAAQKGIIVLKNDQRLRLMPFTRGRIQYVLVGGKYSTQQEAQQHLADWEDAWVLSKPAKK